jgi:hypothetical protein
MLKLPKRPETRGQLRFMRYWLRQLSYAHFEIGQYYANADVLSPEFIGMVFPPAEGTQEENFCLSFDTLKFKVKSTKE